MGICALRCVADEQCRPFRQFHIFQLRQAADGNCTDNFSFFADGYSPAPAREFGIAEVADIEALLGVARCRADLFAGLSFPCRRICFVDSNREGRIRGAVHPREGDQFPMSIYYGDDACLLAAGYFFDQEVDSAPCFGVFNDVSLEHIYQDSEQE